LRAPASVWSTGVSAVRVGGWASFIGGLQVAHFGVAACVVVGGGRCSRQPQTSREAGTQNQGPACADIRDSARRSLLRDRFVARVARTLDPARPRGRQCGLQAWCSYAAIEACGHDRGRGLRARRALTFGRWWLRDVGGRGLGAHRRLARSGERSREAAGFGAGESPVARVRVRELWTAPRHVIYAGGRASSPPGCAARGARIGSQARTAMAGNGRRGGFRGGCRGKRDARRRPEHV
jgi:hypothetical protein